MAEALAQIVCVREDGKDPRTLVAIAGVSKQIVAFKDLKKWDRQAKRPRLELWDDSGTKLDPKTGVRIVVASKAKPVPASPPDPLNASTPS